MGWRVIPDGRHKLAFHINCNPRRYDLATMRFLNERSVAVNFNHPPVGYRDDAQERLSDIIYPSIATLLMSIPSHASTHATKHATIHATIHNTW